MNREQEMKIMEAVRLLDDAGVIFILAYGFPNKKEVMVEGRGDSHKEHQANFLRALVQHWKEDNSFPQV